MAVDLQERWLPGVVGGDAEPESASPPVATRTAARALRVRARRRAQRTALGVVAVWAVAVGVAALVSPSETVHRAALFVHLSSLLVGFGPVLVVDLHGLLWLVRRRSILEVARLAAACDPLIWAGLLGLVASGMLLEPDLALPLIRLKLGLVLIVALNGLQARRLERDMRALPPDAGPTELPPGHLTRAAMAATVSQLAWWGAIGIGLSNMA